MKHVLIIQAGLLAQGCERLNSAFPAFSIVNYQLPILLASGIDALNLAHYSAWGRAGLAPASLLSVYPNNPFEDFT